MPDDQVAAWLAAQTETDARQVAAELDEGDRRRVFVIDELIEAGFAGSELLELAMRLTGATSVEARALIASRTAVARATQSEDAPARDRTLVVNEIVFREVNERVAAAAGSESNELKLVCECTDRSCRKVLTMPAAEYEWLRQDPHRFAVLPGHEAPALEDVVERHEGFVVVEKHVESHRQVEASDPRA